MRQSAAAPVLVLALTWATVPGARSLSHSPSLTPTLKCSPLLVLSWSSSQRTSSQCRACQVRQRPPLLNHTCCHGQVLAGTVLTSADEIMTHTWLIHRKCALASNPMICLPVLAWHSSHFNDRTLSTACILRLIGSPTHRMIS